MGLPAEKRHYSVEEYLQMEETATERHEYHAGEILAMSGGTLDHAQIISNLARVVGNSVRGSPCRSFVSELKVRISAEDRYVYPDLLIACGQIRVDPLDRKKTAILNPRVIIEVLSDSTERYDRGAKFSAYRTLESLEEYILVSQSCADLQSFLRQPDGTWSLAIVSGIEKNARIRCLGIEMPLAEIYANISFDAPSES